MGTNRQLADQLILVYQIGMEADPAILRAIANHLIMEANEGYGDIALLKASLAVLLSEAATRKGAENNNGISERTIREPEGQASGRTEQTKPRC